VKTKKAFSLIAFSVLLLVPVGTQQAFAGFFMADFTLTETLDSGNSTIEYELVNDSTFGNAQEFDDLSVFAFAIEVDESFFGGPLGDGVHIVIRPGWDGGDALGGLIDEQEWNGVVVGTGDEPPDGILLSEDIRFGEDGLYTDNIETPDSFAKFFSGNHRVALFIDEAARNGDFTGFGTYNPIVPGTSSDPGRPRRFHYFFYRAHFNSCGYL